MFILRQNVIRTIIVIVVLISIGIAWWWIDPNSRQEKNDFFATVLTGVGATALIWQLRYTHQSTRLAARTQARAEEGQVAERFFKASEQLGHMSEDVRIAALFSLERLSKDSHDYYSQVIDVICAFIRRRSEDFADSSALQYLETADDVKAAHDLGVAMTILARRSRRLGDGEDIPLNLRGANLSKLQIHEADLDGADFTGATLIGTLFDRCNLAGARLVHADARFATFTDTILIASHFVEADVRDAFFWLEDKLPDLSGRVAIREISGVAPWITTNYSRSKLTEHTATEGGRYLDGSNWAIARMNEARFYVRDLSGMASLTTDQFKSMKKLATAIKPHLTDLDHVAPVPDEENESRLGFIELV